DRSIRAVRRRYRTPRYRGIGAAWKDALRSGRGVASSVVASTGAAGISAAVAAMSHSGAMISSPHETILTLSVISWGIRRRDAGLELGAGHIPRAYVRQIIQHSVAECGGCSGDHACAGLCARAERASLEQSTGWLFANLFTSLSARRSIRF